MRIVDYALAMDGGTQIVEVELDAGETMMIGLDGRIDSPVSGRQLFTGSSPESPDAQLPPIGGSEEAEVIALLEKWLDQTQGFLRRGALIGSDWLGSFRFRRARPSGSNGYSVDSPSPSHPKECDEHLLTIQSLEVIEWVPVAAFPPAS